MSVLHELYADDADEFLGVIRLSNRDQIFPDGR